jgi:cytoskeletal protein RodZ
MGNMVNNPGAKAFGPYEYALGDELRGERATLGKTLLDIQRDLRIKAAYIAAIEDAKPEVFPNPSFIAGYVRSYARYLGLDPDEVFHRFCLESGFAGKTGAPLATGGPAVRGKAAPEPRGGFRPDFAIARLDQPSGFMPAVPFAALGSLMILALVALGLGYGGWTVLQNIQRVQFAPVDDLPVAVAEAGQPESAPTPAFDEPALTEIASPVAATALAELYRKQELEVPIIAPRDGPIAGLDPDKTGLLANAPSAPASPTMPATGGSEVPAALIDASATTAADAPAAPAAPKLVVVAERAAWIRVYLENGTVLFERILEKGETYSPPEGIEAPLIWAGNAGSVYVKVGDALRGPLGRGTRAAKDVLLVPQSVADHFPVVEDVPEVISQAFGTQPAEVVPAVAIQ